MKITKLILMLGLLLAPMAFATESNGPCIPGPDGGGGGDVPIPFTVNQRVELADGETYILIGRVVNHNGQYAFYADLTEHTWLANARRRVSPVYPLEGSADYWRKLEGARIKLPCVAHGEVIADEETGRYSYEISLSPVMGKIELLEPPSHSSRRRKP